MWKHGLCGAGSPACHRLSASRTEVPILPRCTSRALLRRAIPGRIRYHGPVGPTEVLHSAYFRVRVDPRSRLVQLWRSPEPFPSLDAARDAWLSVVAALDRGVARAAACCRTCETARPRNDPAYEQIILQIVPRVHAGFLRNAILVRMAVGALQIKRHAKGMVSSGSSPAVKKKRSPIYEKCSRPALNNRS